jgi:hypothetical protein
MCQGFYDYGTASAGKAGVAGFEQQRERNTFSL